MAYEPRDLPFLRRLQERVLYAAGPIGSTALAMTTAESFTAFKGTPQEETHDSCPEWLNVASPEVLERVFSMFYEAGCDAVDAASFGANQIVLAEFDLAHRTRELNRIAAQVIGRVRDRFSTPEWPRYAFGSIGPGTRLPSLGHTTWDELVTSYKEQVHGLLEGGIDLLKVETCQDLLQTKAALAAIDEVFAETGLRVPVVASVTIETTGTMLLGSDIACALTTLDAIDVVDIIGINCATGPEQMVEHARFLAENCRRPVFIGPNAGIPELVDGQTCYKLTPEDFARYQRIFVREFGTSIAAGCCGTAPEHYIAAIESIGRERGELPEARKQALARPGGGEASSLYTSVPFAQDNSFLVIGERMNATGSRAFRDLLLADDIEGMVSLAREQTAEGAHVLDVMVDYVGRNGVPDMERVTTRLRTQSTLPLVFDSTEPPVIETALKLYGGKAIVNSINLEAGLEKISRVLPIIRRHGAAAIALTIDEEGQARTAEWKVRVARRIHDIAVHDFGMEPADLLFDCLTFPLSSGQEELRKDAMETLNAIRQVKEELPGVHTVLGVSNCSFGLKPPARRVLNSVFLHEAVQHGLDAAIVNAKQIVPLNRIPAEQLEAALDLIYDRRREGYDPLTHFMGLFEGVETEKAVKVDRSTLPVNERLRQRIIDGDRRGIETDLDDALREMPPLTIINEHLLDGMREVGELFGSGKMQLPFVLQSAETMKTAVAYLEPHMEKAEGAGKGTIVLATVRGDVHDIGKNLVDIILSNNGYTVFNIGIKQPISNVIEKANEVKADALGLSGLLVKSTVVMREDLEELNARELAHFPVLLGGAALNRKYVEEDLRAIYNGSVYYCQDAFDGLATMDAIMAASRAGQPAPLLTRGRSGPAPVASADTGYDEVRVAVPAAEPAPGINEYAESEVRLAPPPPVPTPPFWGSRVVRGVPLRDVFPWVNEVALFRGQWQYQKGKSTDEEYIELTEDEVRPIFRRWQDRAIAEQLLVPQAVYGYFPCLAVQNDLLVWPDSADGVPTGTPVRFTFPRQAKGRRLCVADFYLSAEQAGWDPASATPPARFDVVAFSLVTVGPRATEFAQELFAANDYREYLHFHGFAVETAEALAEYFHHRVREELGIAGNDAPTIRQIFAQGYQGSRFSFGYPACPDLSQQVPLVELLDPARIGVELGETFQLHPEQSTSAVIAHHPAARYFNV
jgi:5-methyltetrahydrofolate--homocysteine methyltransferase